MRCRLRSFLALSVLFGAGVVDACSLIRIDPSHPEPFDAPYAVFEGRVVEIHDAEIQLHPQILPDAVANGQEGIVEVVRSFHGPLKPGDRVATSTVTGGGSCGQRATVGDRVAFWESVGPPFTIRGTLAATDHVENAFAALADAPGRDRRTSRPDLANVTLRGKLSEHTAAELFKRARAPGGACRVVQAQRYAEVRCGAAFGGNDAAFKVIFERAGGRWIEVMRWTAPSPDAASAATTS